MIVARISSFLLSTSWSFSLTNCFFWLPYSFPNPPTLDALLLLLFRGEGAAGGMITSVCNNGSCGGPFMEYSKVGRGGSLADHKIIIHEALLWLFVCSVI